MGLLASLVAEQMGWMAARAPWRINILRWMTTISVQALVVPLVSCLAGPWAASSKQLWLGTKLVVRGAAELPR